MVQSILFLGSQMETAGAQEMLLTQAQWFHKQGNQVVAVFFYDKEGRYGEWSNHYPFRVVNLDSWRKGFKPGNLFLLVRGLLALRNLMAENHFDVIETFTHHANFLGLPLAWLMRIPVRVASHHGKQENFPGWLKFIYKSLVNSSIVSWLVVVSEEVRDHAIQNEGISKSKIRIIQNGINITKYRVIPEREKQALRDELNLANYDPVLLTVARLATPKGHVYLLEAVPFVIHEFPQAIFLLAGDGPLRTELDQQARKLEIGHAVRFLGIQKDVVKLLSVADLFVLPSITEGLPIALLEAMAAAKPVVATRVGGVGELVVNEVNGLTVPPGEPVKLSQAILRLLGDRQLAVQYGESARQTIMAGYSAESMCLNYQRLFDESG